MRKWISAVAIILVILALSLSACTEEPAPAPAPAQPAPTAAPTTSAPAPAPAQPEPILIKFASDIPEHGSVCGGWIWWMDEIEAQTGGKVKFDKYWGGSLVKQQDQLDALMSGVVDITNSNAISRRQLLPLTHVFTLPTTVFPDTIEGHTLGRQTALAMIDKYPELGAEYEAFKLLTWNSDPYRMGVGTKPIHVPADLKGLKVGAEGTGKDMADAAGASSVFIIPPETYMSLEKNVITATIACGWNHVQVFKLYEVADNYLDYGFAMGATCLLMNNDSWAKLPADVQKVIMDTRAEAMVKSGQGALGLAEVAKKSVKDSNGTIYTPTPEEAKLWEDIKAPSEQIYLDEMKDRGLTIAPQLLAEVKAAADKAWGR